MPVDTILLRLRLPSSRRSRPTGTRGRCPAPLAARAYATEPDPEGASVWAPAAPEGCPRRPRTPPSRRTRRASGTSTPCGSRPKHWEAASRGGRWHGGQTQHACPPIQSRAGFAPSRARQSSTGHSRGCGTVRFAPQNEANPTFQRSGRHKCEVHPAHHTSATARGRWGCMGRACRNCSGGWAWVEMRRGVLAGRAVIRKAREQGWLCPNPGSRTRLAFPVCAAYSGGPTILAVASLLLERPRSWSPAPTATSAPSGCVTPASAPGRTGRSSYRRPPASRR